MTAALTIAPNPIERLNPRVCQRDKPAISALPRSNWCVYMSHDTWEKFIHRRKCLPRQKPAHVLDYNGSRVNLTALKEAEFEYPAYRMLYLQYSDYVAYPISTCFG